MWNVYFWNRSKAYELWYKKKRNSQERLKKMENGDESNRFIEYWMPNILSLRLYYNNMHIYECLEIIQWNAYTGLFDNDCFFNAFIDSTIVENVLSADVHMQPHKQQKTKNLFLCHKR